MTVTDRTQLDDQIANTFQRCGFPAPERIDRSRPEPEHLRQRRRARNPDQPDPLDLQTALQRGGGRTFITTIQKFEEALDTPGGSLDVLNASDNVIIMVDEAHRTQYGLLGARMAQALPNAVLVGFTGTPIDKGFGRSTMGHFGSLIDAYTIPQSVADGATVRIMYEARLPELNIQGPETLDKLFDAIFHEESEEERAQIRRRYANKETIAEAEKRIQMISLDIAEHFKTKVRPNGFKAQVVAPSRAAALRYTDNLKNFGVSAYPIITTSATDGPEFQEARGLPQTQITNAFVDPDGDPEVLVVVDMLLTGFDAPVEQVLYLDRSLREHGLLQAVARVNRRFSHEHDGVPTEKNYGLVVDYHGVSQDLQEALESFDWPDVQDTMIPIEDDPAAVIDAAAVQAEAHFDGRDLGDTWDCVNLFAADADTEGDFKADLFERFNHDYRQFSSLMDRILPDPRALPYVDRLARLTEIRAYTRAQYLRENANLDWTDIGAKVKKLIDDRIDADVRKLMEPVSVLDEDFEEKVASLPHDEARASVMEHAIRAYINTRLADNPAFFEKLSEQLERIIRDLRDHVIDSAEAMRQADLLKRQLHTEEDVAAEHGLSPVSFAIFELIRTRDGDTAPGSMGRAGPQGRRPGPGGSHQAARRRGRVAVQPGRAAADAAGYQAGVAPLGELRRAPAGRAGQPDSRDGPAAGRMKPEQGSVRFGGTTIQYHVRRSARRRKTVDITVDGAGVQVAVPQDTPDEDVRDIVRRRAPWILAHAPETLLEALPKGFVSGETLPYLGRNVRMVVVGRGCVVRRRSALTTGG